MTKPVRAVNPNHIFVDTNVPQYSEGGRKHFENKVLQ